jgi:hypothetical protein
VARARGGDVVTAVRKAAMAAAATGVKTATGVVAQVEEALTQEAVEMAEERSTLVLAEVVVVGAAAAGQVCSDRTSLGNMTACDGNYCCTTYLWPSEVAACDSRVEVLVVIAVRRCTN